MEKREYNFNRNYNVDIIRALATIQILVYHLWVTVSNSKPLSNPYLYSSIAMSGEIGVTIFFVLSGYGIYYSLHSMEIKQGEINYWKYLKKRMVRILPEYYVSLLIVILISDGGWCFTIEQAGNLLSHLFLIHNWFYQYNGSLNGVLWTMGTIFNFYLIAPILYKSFRKIGLWNVPIVIAFTMVSKYITYRFIVPTDADGIYRWWIGRQPLPNSIDNFVIGMGIAYFVLNENGKVTDIKNKFRELLRNRGGYTIGIIAILAMLIGIIIYSNQGITRGINNNNLFSYSWYSVIAILIGCIVLIVSLQKQADEKNSIVLFRGMIWVSKYEYSIYIWHLVIINNLMSKSSTLNMIRDQGLWWVDYLVLGCLSITFGWIFSTMMIGLRRSK